jgi:hypothetical protein
MVDGPVPDTAMDTKSEDEPGATPDPTPLSADERALLDRLRDTSGDAPDGPVATDTLPPAPPADAGPDPLDAVFREPGP